MNLINPEFQHRQNSKNSWDSICLKCFRTVTTENEERALAEREKEHVCDPEDLAVVNEESPQERE